MAKNPDEMWERARRLVDAALAQMSVENLRDLVAELEAKLGPESHHGEVKQLFKPAISVHQTDS